jgi:protein ImuB
LLLEIGGSVRLFGGLGLLLQTIRDDLRHLQHVVMSGVAPTPMAAWLLARAGHTAPVGATRHLAGALSGVPVHCLELPQRTLDDLRALGVHTFGECMRLPRDGLTRRFGPGLLDVMDRALGVCADPRPRWAPAAHFERRLELAFASADRALLMRGVELLLAELAGFLNTHDCGAGALELQLAHQGAPATRISLELVAPSRDPRHLKALLAQRVERVPIHHQVLHLGMRVSRLLALAPRTGDLYSSKAGLKGGSKEPSQPAEHGDSPEQCGQLLVERLGARLGPERVCTLSRVDDHRPEHSSLELPWHVRHCRGRKKTPLTIDSGMPLWLLAQPRPLAAGGLGDGRLVLEDGPCRIESGWWDGHDVARDYYVARSARGSRYWIFRECRKSRQWYVHGLFA